jgi:hypothetical protein
VLPLLQVGFLQCKASCIVLCLLRYSTPLLQVLLKGMFVGKNHRDEMFIREASDLFEIQVWMSRPTHLLENGQCKCADNLLEFFPLTLIKHGLSQQDISSKDAILLQIGQGSVQGGTKVQGLQWRERREEWAEFL